LSRMMSLFTLTSVFIRPRRGDVSPVLFIVVQPSLFSPSPLFVIHARTSAIILFRSSCGPRYPRCFFRGHGTRNQRGKFRLFTPFLPNLPLSLMFYFSRQPIWVLLSLLAIRESSLFSLLVLQWFVAGRYRLIVPAA